jgi:hypothetical protein
MISTELYSKSELKKSFNGTCCRKEVKIVDKDTIC